MNWTGKWSNFFWHPVMFSVLCIISTFEANGNLWYQNATLNAMFSLWNVFFYYFLGYNFILHFLSMAVVSKNRKMQFLFTVHFSMRNFFMYCDLLRIIYVVNQGWRNQWGSCPTFENCHRLPHHFWGVAVQWLLECKLCPTSFIELPPALSILKWSQYFRLISAKLVCTYVEYLLWLNKNRF